MIVKGTNRPLLASLLWRRWRTEPLLIQHFRSPFYATTFVVLLSLVGRPALLRRHAQYHRAVLQRRARRVGCKGNISDKIYFPQHENYQSRTERGTSTGSDAAITRRGRHLRRHPARSSHCHSGRPSGQSRPGRCVAPILLNLLASISRQTIGLRWLSRSPCLLVFRFFFWLQSGISYQSACGLFCLWSSLSRASNLFAQSSALILGPCIRLGPIANFSLQVSQVTTPHVVCDGACTVVWFSFTATTQRVSMFLLYPV
jgi:hypothetical protein